MNEKMKSLGKILAERSERERLDVHNLLTNFPTLEEDVQPDTKDVYPERVQSYPKGVSRNEFNQLKGFTLHLQKKVNELSDKKKKEQTPF